MLVFQPLVSEKFIEFSFIFRSCLAAGTYILERTSDVVQCKEIDKGVRTAWRWEWLEGEVDSSERLSDCIQNVCNVVCNFLLVHAVCQEPIKDAKCHRMP